MPKAGKAVKGTDGSGGQISRSKGLGKDEVSPSGRVGGANGKACTTCKGEKLLKGKPCPTCCKSELDKCGEVQRVGKAEDQKQPVRHMREGGLAARPKTACGTKVDERDTTTAWKHVTCDECCRRSGYTRTKKDEVPIAKPPSGNAQNKPAPAPKPPKQPAMKSEPAALIRSQMLSVADTSAASLNVGELAKAAAHHYLGMEAALSRQDEGAAARHAHAGTLYERLLGSDPQRGPCGIVAREMAQGLAKGEAPAEYVSHASDTVVGEDRLWKSAGLEKAGAFGLPGVGGRRVGVASVDEIGPGTPALMHMGAKRLVNALNDVKKPPSVGRKRGQWPVVGQEAAEAREAAFGGKTAASAPSGPKALPVTSSGASNKPAKGPALPGVTGRKPAISSGGSTK